MVGEKVFYTKVNSKVLDKIHNIIGQPIFSFDCCWIYLERIREINFVITAHNCNPKEYIVFNLLFKITTTSNIK